MRCHRLAALVAALGILASLIFPSLALADTAGTVAIIEGNAYAQKGEIYFTRPNVGAEVKVNQFGQYSDSKPVPAFVKWVQETRRHLRPNDVIEEGDIIQTMGDGWAKVLFKDDSILDIGPGSLVQVKTFVAEGNNRNVLIKALYGRFRSIVAQPLAGPQKYQFITPTALMGVRGTEFLVNVFPDAHHKNQTEVVCVHGQVSIDTAQFTRQGLVYTQPTVLNPGAMFTSGGVHGLGQTTTGRAVPQTTLRELVSRISPHVDVRGTLTGASPPPNRLPGTGLKMVYVADASPRKVKAKDQNISSFDTDHPPADRQIASPSDNFKIPNDYQPDAGAFGGLRDLGKITGAPPISTLPATTSHVRVILGF
jgi:hypothetical protein